MSEEEYKRTKRRTLGLRWLTFAFAFTPYVGLLLYLRWELHAEDIMARVPGPLFLAVLALFGVILPSVGVVRIVTRLVENRERFLLGRLLESYFCLILLFASGYALVQASSPEPAFGSMTRLWHVDATFWEHVRDLHLLFVDALYLSIITITTVGYGDLAPTTFGGKVLTALEGLVGIGFVGLALGHYFSVCTHCPKDSLDGSELGRGGDVK